MGRSGVSHRTAAAAIASRANVDHLTKAYGRLTALSDVSLTIRAREVLEVIGPNGAGKTTLFECLAGVLPHDTGTVSVDGKLLPPRDRSSKDYVVSPR